jgi:Resolvase, N terminal domain
LSFVLACLRTPWLALTSVSQANLEVVILQLMSAMHDVAESLKQKWRRNVVKFLLDPTAYAEASYKDALANTWRHFPHGPHIATIWTHIMTGLEPQEAGVREEPGEPMAWEKEGLHDDLLEESWYAVLHECGLRQLLTFQQIRDMISSGISDLGLGYCRTSDVKKADERSSSLYRQRQALSQLRGCICVGFAYNGGGEPSYLPMRHERRPESARVLRLLGEGGGGKLSSAFNRLFAPRIPQHAVKYLCIEAIHRLSRETKHGLADIDDLSSMGVRILCQQDHVAYVADTCELQPSCKLTVTIMLANATYLRSQIVTNTSVGRVKAQGRITALAKIPYHGLLGGGASPWHHPAFSLKFAHAVMLLVERQGEDSAAVDALIFRMNEWLQGEGEEQACIRQLLGDSVTVSRKDFIGRICAKWHQWAVANDIFATEDAEAQQMVASAIEQASPSMLASFLKRANKAAAGA